MGRSLIMTRTLTLAFTTLCLLFSPLGEAAAGQKAPSPKPTPAPVPAPVVPPPSTAPARSATAPSTASDIGYLTASMLADRCKRADPSSSSYCFAYIAAVTDTVRAYEIWLDTREFCLPPNTSQAEIRRTFMTYINAYPNRAAGQAASVVVNALKETYPCS